MGSYQNSFPKIAAIIHVYMGLRFLLLSSASRCARTHVQSAKGSFSAKVSDARHFQSLQVGYFYFVAWAMLYGWYVLAVSSSDLARN